MSIETNMILKLLLSASYNETMTVSSPHCSIGQMQKKKITQHSSEVTETLFFHRVVAVHANASTARMEDGGSVPVWCHRRLWNPRGPCKPVNREPSTYTKSEAAKYVASAKGTSVTLRGAVGKVVAYAESLSR
jgi:hypothetical protein